nr:metalloregulator ArsR/SmtB family transcription factor [Pseudonocardia sp. AL041005-10]
MVVQYPVARATASPLSVSVARRRLAVLADDARLALCRHLVNEAITTSDLALRTGMSAPQVSRHLSRLRDAELLTTERSGRQSFHRLDTQKLMQLGPELLRALVR